MNVLEYRWIQCFGLSFLCLLFTGCLDQFNPRPDWRRFEQEREATTEEPLKLTEDGELPYDLRAGPGEVVAEVRPASELYATYCSSCHGAEGKGNGPAGMALNPKPRNFHDQQWQAKVDDDRIYGVIAKGGIAYGLSGTMAQFGGVLSEDEMTSLVEYVRAFGQQGG